MQDCFVLYFCFLCKSQQVNAESKILKTWEMLFELKIGFCAKANAKKRGSVLLT
jgi:hypothetical protein